MAQKENRTRPAGSAGGEMETGSHTRSVYALRAHPTIYGFCGTLGQDLSETFFSKCWKTKMLRPNQHLKPSNSNSYTERSLENTQPQKNMAKNDVSCKIPAVTCLRAKRIPTASRGLKRPLYCLVRPERKKMQCCWELINRERKGEKQLFIT